MKRAIIFTSVATVTIGLSGVAFGLSQPSEDSHTDVKPIRSTAQVAETETIQEPVQSTLAVPAETAQASSDPVTPPPVPTASVTPAPTSTTAVRTYDELAAAYGFSGDINTEALATLRSLYPERFTPDTIEQSFRYLRNISSSVDHRFVRTYGWNLPQYQ